MFKRSFLFIVFLLAFSTICFSQMVVPYAKTLEQYGFTFWKNEGGEIYYKNGGVVTVAKMNRDGNIIGTIVAFNKISDNETVLIGTYINYLTMQTQLGKDLAFNPLAGLRKMKYLYQTVFHNLSLSEKTKFQYDDLIVHAFRKENVTFISFEY